MTATLTAPVTLSLTCQVSTEPAEDTHTIPYTLGFDVTAPAAVPAGAPFEVTVRPHPLLFSPKFSSRVWDLRIAFRPPAGALTARHRLLADAGTVPAEARADGDDGGLLTLCAPGPVVPGEWFTLPGVAWTATAGPGGAVEFALGGTGFDAPGWSYRWEQAAKGMSGVVTGHPDRSAVLARVLIG
ncbi:hypothetical protein [Streptomyces sp. CBMA123]|uniref:hypothetical protein n=1 Tax=Streptomyces sp. CBMA123 TaxID=1896313 RepID=UPI001661DE18|nr:hypothetical protein [Streptomyces sp. CBMA123]MBD0694987.1 hypothetical protein [Streptomyces sp. CBMA123]